MLLTKSGGWLGPVATILGYIMDAIFSFCNMLSLPNIGLCIILFTIVIYLLMMPHLFILSCIGLLLSFTTFYFVLQFVLLVHI